MEVYGLFGEKLSHSMSPIIHKILFEKYKIDATYSLFEIRNENFKNAVNSIKTLNIKGVNITIPYKIEIIEQLDEIDDSVLKIGACNTIKITNNNAKGFNTDYYGVLDTFKLHKIDIKDKDCVILGSGGASKGIVCLLKDLGAKSITIVQRTKNGTNYDNVYYINYDELKSIKKSFLLINGTPVGMTPNIDESPVSKEILKKFEVCFDAVYNPLQTKFLKDAKELNLITIDGLYMLVGQAINAFEIFNDIKLDKEDFINIYKEVSKLLTI